MEYEQFDRRLARECAKAFSQSTGLGCTLSDKTGRAFDEYGYGCESCGMCAAAGASHDRCVQAHIYGMTEAERFGGKYIYFCPMGLTCFVSPILGEGGAEAKITVGPFIMVEKQDFIACELTENVRLTEAQKQAAVQVLENIPFVPTERVTQLSVLLFMAVGFMNNVSAENRMMESGHSEELQGQITSYILELKQEEAPPPYPFEKEHVLLQCVARKDRDGARRLLNELLGAILFVDGGDMELVKSRLYELLVLISRTAIENGADAEHTMRLSHEYRYRIGAFTTIDSLCLWLAGVVNHFMDGRQARQHHPPVYTVHQRQLQRAHHAGGHRPDGVSFSGLPEPYFQAGDGRDIQRVPQPRAREQGEGTFAPPRAAHDGYFPGCGV